MLKIKTAESISKAEIHEQYIHKVRVRTGIKERVIYDNV